MAVNAEVNRNKNESAINTIRRFSRKARNIGFMRLVRSKRYYSRQDSQLRRKQGAIARIEATERYEELRKLGKIS